jgi:hypothetical protein
MIGIVFLFILFILFILVHCIAKLFSNIFPNDDNSKLQKRLYRITLGFIIFVLVGDEIVGGTQLAYFCLSEPKVQKLVDDLKGRTVQSTTAFQVEENTVLTVTKGITRFIDVKNQEIVATGYLYKSQGGWLSRLIAFNGSKAPFLFSGSCSNSKELYQLPITNNMKLLR